MRIRTQEEQNSKIRPSEQLIVRNGDLRQTAVMIFEVPLIAGTMAGLIVGLAFRSPKLGCAVLWIVPVAVIAYFDWWQNAHPENLRSTSGLALVFVSLPWSSMGAMAGYLVGIAIRHAAREKRDGS